MTPLEAWRLHCSAAPHGPATEEAARVLLRSLTGELRPFGADVDEAQRAGEVVLTRNRGKRARLLHRLHGLRVPTPQQLSQLGTTGATTEEVEDALGRQLEGWESDELARRAIDDEQRLFVMLRTATANAARDQLRREAAAARAREGYTTEVKAQGEARVQAEREQEAAREIAAAEQRKREAWDAFAAWKATKAGFYADDAPRVIADLHRMEAIATGSATDGDGYDGDSHRRRCDRLRAELTKTWPEHRLQQGEDRWVVCADAVIAEEHLRQRQRPKRR